MEKQATNSINLLIESNDGASLRVRWSRPISGLDYKDLRAKRGLEANLKQCMWNGTLDAYLVPATDDNVAWLKTNYPSLRCTDELAEQQIRIAELLQKKAQRHAEIVQNFLVHKKAPEITDYVFKREPNTHQRVGFELVRTDPFLGLLCEMGTGKTKMVNDGISYLASKRKDKSKPYRVIIGCPRSVMVNWVREMHLDCTVSYAIAIMSKVGNHILPELREKGLVASGRSELRALEAAIELIKHKDVDLQVLIVNYDNIPGRIELLKKIGFDLAVLDESHRIKGQNTKRSKACIELAESCHRRIILTGTPLTQNPMDLFPQFEFLAPKQGLLGYTTAYAFQNAHAEMGGYKGRKVKRWVNLGGLLERVAKYAFVLKKEQCIDLPPKIYERVEVEMTAEQREIYEQVSTEVLLVLEGLGAEVTIQNILVQYLRLAQVTSGYVKTVDGREVKIPKGNVKIEALKEVLEENGITMDNDDAPKVVIWSRFVHEIKEIYEALSAEGLKCVQYYGGVNDEDRQIAIDSFQNDNRVKVFIGNAQTGGEGITLTQASLVVYVSNDFSLGRRLQSEDRVHRIGQSKSVTYVDLVVEESIDELVVARLAEKRDMATRFSDPGEIRASLVNFLRGTTGQKEGDE